MGEVEIINLDSKYLKADLNKIFRKNYLSADIVLPAVSGHEQPFQ